MSETFKLKREAFNKAKRFLGFSHMLDQVKGDITKELLGLILLRLEEHGTITLELAEEEKSGKERDRE